MVLMEMPDYLVNFAAESHVDRSILDPDPFLKTNILGTHVLLKSALEFNKRFLQISTDEVYGSIENGSAREDSNLNPSSPYSASKTAADLLCISYYTTHKLPVIIVRSSNNFGPYQFPEKIKQLNKINNIKNKKIITYCTGGVRCEKASAFLKENGFNDVYQLHGGILTYGQECGDSHWEGKCFVFDTRGAVDIDPNSQSEPITQCVLCNLPNSDLHNCALTSCDKFFTACEDCLRVLKGCCSKRCRGEINI